MPESRGPTLRQALHRTARHHADNEALADSQHRYTYRQMLARAQQTAALLFGLGVRKGDRVALMMLPVRPRLGYCAGSMSSSVAAEGRESFKLRRRRTSSGLLAPESAWEGEIASAECSF